MTTRFSIALSISSLFTFAFAPGSAADDLMPPPWSRDGASNYTTAAEWEFLADAGSSPYVADGVEVPIVNGDGFGGVSPQVLVSGDIGWVPYDGDGGYLGGASGTGPGALNFRIANWVDDEPLKIIWMQIVYDPGPAAGSPYIDTIIPTDDTDPITRIELMSVTDAAIAGDPLGRWHRLEVWEIEENPDFESILVVVPEGVTVDQVVVDTISTVPEPASLGVLAIGGLLVSRRRR